MIPVGDSINLTDHKHLENKIGRIAEKIKDQGEKRRLLADLLKHLKNDIKIPIETENNGPIEPNLVYPVGKESLQDLVVVGVDGGVLSKPLHGLDLILVRAAAAIFQYKNGKLKEAEYHPSEAPAPKLVNVHEPLNSQELDLLTGLKRQLTELKRAREAIENKNVDVLMLDGSIVPQYVHQTSKTKTKDLYKKLLNNFTNLYEKCVQEETLLLGAVEDSRSTRLAKIFQKEIFPTILENSNLTDQEIDIFNKNKNIIMNSRDTAFLDYLLEAGERSFAFKYSKAPANLLKDLEPWSERICAFYIKPVPYDRPTRVEFITKPKNPEKTIEKAAALVNSLSASHEACALPSVLIEADARAALSQEEISILRDSIADRLEPSTMLDLRRERRPF